MTKPMAAATQPRPRACHKIGKILKSYSDIWQTKYVLGGGLLYNG
jgi:hypothetical protein